MNVPLWVACKLYLEGLKMTYSCDVSGGHCLSKSCARETDVGTVGF